MSSNASSQTGSISCRDALNEARIEGDDTYSLIVYSTQSKSSRNKKCLPQQIDDFDYRGSLSQLIRSLDQQQKLETPCIKKQIRKYVIDHTKTHTIKNKKGKPYTEICPICLTQFEQQLGQLPCSHKFCFQCIKQWSNTSTGCPCCRVLFKIIRKHTKNQSKIQIKVQQKIMQFKEEDYYICYVCGSGDNQNVLFICDQCDFYCCHVYCDGELGGVIPVGEWYCQYCRARRRREDRRDRRERRERRDEVGDISRFSQISSIENQSEENQQEEEKPIAQRTRSRNLQQNEPAHVLRRLRRRR